jgi:NitT/TauT family transport system substrate-binding protein
MRLSRALAIIVALCAFTAPVRAEDVIKVAASDYGSFPNIFPELGNRTGIFAKHGLRADILYTQGGGETLQAVLSGGVDVGMGVGSYAAFSSIVKGAPLRVIGNAMAGVDDLMWFVRADSNIKSLKEAAGRTVAYSTAGSSTQMVVKAFARQYGVAFKETATGGMSPTLTQVMSGQIDVGWGSAPQLIAPLLKNEVRVVAKGAEVDKYRDHSVRLIATDANHLATRGDILDRFIKAYDETVTWVYENPASMKMYADAFGITEDEARGTRELYPIETVRPRPPRGFDVLMDDAIELKFIPARLTDAQMKELFAVPIK